MIRTNMLQTSAARKIVEQRGMYTLMEYERDLSVSPESAATAYFASRMNVRKRQVVANMDGTKGVILQAGAMQMMMGNIQAATNIKGASDLMRKFVGSKVTGESAVKPKYVGYGLLVLEPTYRYILFEDLANWNGNMVIEDGLFLACDDTIDLRVVARTNLSSAVLGNEGLFNSCLTGHGIAVLEVRFRQKNYWSSMWKMIPSASMAAWPSPGPTPWNSRWREPLPLLSVRQPPVRAWLMSTAVTAVSW